MAPDLAEAEVDAAAGTTVWVTTEAGVDEVLADVGMAVWWLFNMGSGEFGGN